MTAVVATMDRIIRRAEAESEQNIRPDHVPAWVAPAAASLLDYKRMELADSLFQVDSASAAKGIPESIFY